MAKATGVPAGKPKKKGKTMQTGTGQVASTGTGPQVDSRIQNEIGKHLRAHYDDVMNEPVPDKFMELLMQLEQSVTRKK